MTHAYHYCVLTKPEALCSAGKLDHIDMENVDYKRQPDPAIVASQIQQDQGYCCGIFHGGMFGLATNQIAVLSAWDERNFNRSRLDRLADRQGWLKSADERLLPTVRPTELEVCARAGIYVIRWIRIHSSDIDEYTRLCLETWPRFEAATNSRCYGVFRPRQVAEISKLLMLTWYATLTDWEASRKLDPADTPKWARRSEMELSHWAEAGRLASTS